MLNDAKIKGAKPKAKRYTLHDAEGLFLAVEPWGRKYWLLRYALDGKTRRMSLGKYPAVGLAAARDLAGRERAKLASPTPSDPITDRRLDVLRRREITSGTFEDVAQRWMARQVWAEGNRTRNERLIAKANRTIGARPLADLTAREIVTAVLPCAEKGSIETAWRMFRLIRAVVRYGRALLDIHYDAADAALVLLRELMPDHVTRHRAAIIEPAKLADLLRGIWAYQGTPAVRAALKLAPLLFVRPGELRHAKWSQVDFERAEWVYPVSKQRRKHIEAGRVRMAHVPLATQALEVLRELQAHTGNGEYLFPSARGRDRPMSDNAVLTALRALGIPKEVMSGHGFRATAKTNLKQVLGFADELIEYQLSHLTADKYGEAYDRATFEPQRRAMMQRWADWLTELREAEPKTNVLPFRAPA